MGSCIIKGLKTGVQLFEPADIYVSKVAVSVKTERSSSMGVPGLGGTKCDKSMSLPWA
jgi:hypothetical protein